MFLQDFVLFSELCTPVMFQVDWGNACGLKLKCVISLYTLETRVCILSGGEGSNVLILSEVRISTRAKFQVDWSSEACYI